MKKENIKKNDFNAYMNSFKFILKQFSFRIILKALACILCMDFFLC